MNNQITYANKVALNQNSSVPDINKVNATDMNEIKAKHNGVMNGSIPMGNVVVDSIRSKNMFDKNSMVYTRYGYFPYDTSSTQLKNYGGIGPATLVIKLEAGKTYTISKMAGARFRAGFTNTPTPTLDTDNVITSRLANNDTGTSMTFTVPSGSIYFVCNFFAQDQTADANIGYENMVNSIQIESGSTATSYAPYQNLGNSKPINYASRLTPLANISFNTNKQIFEKNSEGLVIVNLTFVANASIDMVGNADLFQLPPDLNPSGNIVLTIASTTQNLVNTAYIRTANATIRGKLNATINQGSEISLIGSYYI